MPVQWFAEIYDSRFNMYNVLQRRKRLEHEASMAREMHHDFHPSDLEHDGEAHFSKLIAKESALTELTVGRLMGNYILFSDAYIPVQTGMAFYRAVQVDGGNGTFYSLGSDVHCLFYKPAGEALPMPDPKECFTSIANHASMTGRRFEVGYAAAFETFTDVLESRKEGLGGSWFTAPGESSADAFMRRLKKSDPAYEIYAAYAVEHAEKWAGAKALTMEAALAEMPEIERKYDLECTEYGSVMFGLNDEFAPARKLEAEQIAKLADLGKLQPQLDSGALVVVEGASTVTSADAVAKLVEDFESGKDKAVDAVLATKLPSLDKRK